MMRTQRLARTLMLAGLTMGSAMWTSLPVSGAGPAPPTTLKCGYLANPLRIHAHRRGNPGLRLRHRFGLLRTEAQRREGGHERCGSRLDDLPQARPLQHI